MPRRFLSLGHESSTFIVKCESRLDDLLKNTRSLMMGFMRPIYLWGAYIGVTVDDPDWYKYSQSLTRSGQCFNSRLLGVMFAMKEG